MKKLTIGILAHVDSGKTTLSEAMLYTTGNIRKIGRVDHKNAFLDTHNLEKNRGITIFSKQARLVMEEAVIDLLDTPGHVDFSAEMERVLSVLDYAILVVSGSEGVQGHTETLWTLINRYKIPTFIFVNKMDLTEIPKELIFKDIQERLSVNCIDFSAVDMVENIAMCSDELTEEYLSSGDIKKTHIIDEIYRMRVFPCFFGSALKLDGIENFLKEFASYTKEIECKDEFGAKVFKISWDLNGQRLTHIKLTGGSLKVRDVVKGIDKNGTEFSEKVNQIRVYSGGKFTNPDTVYSGDICTVTGLTSTYAGQGLGFESNSLDSVLEPVLAYSVILPIDVDAVTAHAHFKILEQENPEFKITWNSKTKEILIKLMGEIQIEILQSLIMERFGYPVDFDKGSIIYKETIADEVIGVGHFEPLKHYSEVHLKIEALERGSGIVFDNIAKTDDFDRNYQNLVMTHLMEKNHLGVLTGSNITDVKITLIDGRAHIKHTEGGDFREATYRAVRQGLMQAQSVLLEPIYAFTLDIPTENITRALSDIQRMGGEFDTPESNSDFTRLTGRVPVSTSREYVKDVMQYTRGRGKLSFNLHGYDRCHNSEEMIKAIGYNAEADTENTADSVFCSHGSGFTVKWDKVREFAHIKIQEDKEDSDETPVRRVRNYSDSGLALVDDKELLSIFENTYGKVKKDPRISFASHKSKGEVKYKRAKPLPLGPEYLLVDGYNIIFAWEELNELAKINIEGARNKFIDILNNYCGFKKCELILVFDAYKVKGNVGSVEKYGNINVVYTKEAETADMYIEKVTHAIAKKCRVRVATSDAVEQMIIMGHGALRVSASAFRDEVQQTEQEIRELIASTK